MLATRRESENRQSLWARAVPKQLFARSETHPQSASLLRTRARSAHIRRPGRSPCAGVLIQSNPALPFHRTLSTSQSNQFRRPLDKGSRQAVSSQTVQRVHSPSFSYLRSDKALSKSKRRTNLQLLFVC